ncbi:polyribonucleotide nucleotidyltransferase [Candidatus Saccharibacteria bacterium]|nr:polyribonucleotide nucleotidyltransferase [Candidatus Saccharibacteria bacterium]
MEIIHPFGGKTSKFETEFADKKLIIETGNMAFRADGSVTVRYGDTMVLATAIVEPKPRPETDFFPLMIDYEERWYASGKISGSRYMKREARPSDKAILTARLIDRPIRPLFPKGYRNDVQVVVTVLSVDLENEPDIISIIAASTALMLAGTPFEGPVAAVRIGQVDDKLVVNPTLTEQLDSKLNLTVAGTKDAIMMVESVACEVDEQTILDGFELAIKAWQPVIDLQNKMVKDLGVSAKDFELFKPNEEVEVKIREYLKDRLGERVRHADKTKRHDAIMELHDEIMSEFGLLPDDVEDDGKTRYGHPDIELAFEKIIDGEIRRAILEEATRPDNRKNTEIRSLSMQVGIIPRTHGSGLFTRGATQALTLTTLAPAGAAQQIESMDEDTEKFYLHHYNFPPFSIGEARPMRSTSRREIGHGNLAERALAAVLPTKEEFPYTIRIVTEILSSAGSTSMAATCGSTLSLMDAGVPIKSPVSGIAMGLMVNHQDPSQNVILSDIQDAEDFAGDMDFKVTGTADGITALQMDIKLKGLSLAILKTALEQGKQGRLEILQAMNKVIATPRDDLSPYAPRITKLQINPDKIREVIGKGGETIQRITAETGVDIDIEDSGLIMIASADAGAAKTAKEMIEAIVAEPEVGKVYNGKVIKVMDFGAFVEIMPGKEGMVHVSQIRDERVEDIRKELTEGDEVSVKLTEIDDRGRLNLSMKAARQK